MREHYSEQRFSHPFVEWLYLGDADEEDPGASDWIGLYGRNVVIEEAIGVVHREKFNTRDAAKVRFLALQAERHADDEAEWPEDECGICFEHFHKAGDPTNGEDGETWNHDDEVGEFVNEDGDSFICHAECGLNQEGFKLA